MPVKTCTHIKVNGVRCDSPALRKQQFCYFHQRIHHSVRFPNSRLHHVAQLESPEAIQASIMEIVDALLRGNIELKRAELILRALNIAVRNARRANFEFHASEMVRDIPNFEPEDDANQADGPLDRLITPPLPTHQEIVAAKAAHLANYQKHASPQAQVDKTGRAQVTEPASARVRIDAACPEPSQRVRPPSDARVPAASTSKTRVGMAALGRPGGPEVPVPSALHANSPTVSRKPPASARQSPAPKERKITARGASRG